MGRDSKIGWTDHTFNAWIGCSKVNEGCRYCYAEREDRRRGWTAGGWGAGKPRHRTSPATWRQPLKWCAEAIAAGQRRRVFCGSLMDVFDAEVDPAWRGDLWDLIEVTCQMERAAESGGGLDWLLLTKRPENAHEMLRRQWSPNRRLLIQSIWLGYSACNQATLDEAAPVMESLAWAWAPRGLFVSLEPLLGPVDLRPWLADDEYGWTDPETGDYERGNWGLDWVIVGCESGPERRPMDPRWVAEILNQCQEAGTPAFVKQMSWNGKVSADVEYWPRRFRVQEFPDA